MRLDILCVSNWYFIGNNILQVRGKKSSFLIQFVIFNVWNRQHKTYAFTQTKSSFMVDFFYYYSACQRHCIICCQKSPANFRINFKSAILTAQQQDGVRPLHTLLARMFVLGWGVGQQTNLHFDLANAFLKFEFYGLNCLSSKYIELPYV